MSHWYPWWDASDGAPNGPNRGPGTGHYPDPWDAGAGHSYRTASHGGLGGADLSDDGVHALATDSSLIYGEVEYPATMGSSAYLSRGGAHTCL